MYWIGLFLSMYFFGIPGAIIYCIIMSTREFYWIGLFLSIYFFGILGAIVYCIIMSFRELE